MLCLVYMYFVHSTTLFPLNFDINSYFFCVVLQMPYVENIDTILIVLYTAVQVHVCSVLHLKKKNVANLVLYAFLSFRILSKVFFCFCDFRIFVILSKVSLLQYVIFHFITFLGFCHFFFYFVFFYSVLSFFNIFEGLVMVSRVFLNFLVCSRVSSHFLLFS